MLVDISEIDSALGRDFIGDDEENSMFFVETYERLAKGVYQTSFFFKILGKDLLSDEDVFGSIERNFWAEIQKYGDDRDNPEATALREAYWAHMNDDSLPKSSYGVCDSYEQILEKFPKLETDSHRFVISMNEVRKSEQSPDGGWRWHKWGEYIGNKSPQNEYLFDEDDTIESVFTYEILVLKD